VGRIWSTSVRAAGLVSLEAQQARVAAAADRKEQTKAAAFEARYAKCLRILAESGPMTRNMLRTAAHLSGTACDEVCDLMLERGDADECEVETTRGRKPGLRAATPDAGQRRTTSDNAGLSDVPTPDGQGGPYRAPVRCPVSSDQGGDEF